MPKEFTKIQGVIQRALARTETLWPDLAAAYGQVWAVARILANEVGLSGAGVRQALETALAALAPREGQSAWLQEALAEFCKVTASYWPGLFHCYDLEGLGRTNNDLEQFFGSWRWYERRASGRARAPRARRCSWGRPVWPAQFRFAHQSPVGRGSGGGGRGALA